MANITKTTEEYILKHPDIKECLINNLINYSKLARVISKECSINKIDAIIAASRRIAKKLKKKPKKRVSLIIVKSDIKKGDYFLNNC